MPVRHCVGVERSGQVRQGKGRRGRIVGEGKRKERKGEREGRMNLT